MPKAVDIYVLEKKIGSGQFGDVFRGYSKVDGTDVAIKTINRSKIKGKFTELLDNEIKVLKSCKNNNIVRLIDIKKTANNIYLVLDYCNEGDLGAYLKEKKKINEDEAVEYFVQILHAFQTLVKNKIMHRDFKLPNVLKHNGVIKIADFGFAKLLGTEDQQVQTILGSPLNMAPEVLDRQAYNSKADIWSIGVSFYEMIFGKVPFTATNIIDLLKKIRKQPVTFPCKVPKVIEDVIRRMLVVDPAKRIDWNELFEHPITRYLEDKLQENLRQSLVGDKNDFKFNLSKFYIKTNMVIESPYEINTKQELNNHIKEMMKKQTPEHFQGKIIKRYEERTVATDPNEDQLRGTQKQINEDEGEEPEQKEHIRKSQVMKENWKTLLYHRNVYAFYGHLAEDTIQHNFNIYGECLTFLLLKKVITLLGWLSKNIKTRQVEGVKDWEEFQKTAEHSNILQLIVQEEDIFNSMYEKLALKVLEKGTLSQFQDDLMLSGKFTVEQTQRRTYIRVMKEYFARVFSKQPNSTPLYKHVIKLIDSVDAEDMFHKAFDFSSYYSTLNEIDGSDLIKEGQKKYSYFLKSLAVGQ